MIGFRVFDIGLLIVWLIWFFRLRDSSDDDDDADEEDGGGGGGTPPKRGPRGPGGGGLRLPDGRVPAGGRRSRDGHRPRHVPHDRRPAPPLPSPLPARVRSPGAPARVQRRSALPGVFPQISGLRSHSCSKRSAGDPGGGGVSFSGLSSG